MPATSTPAMPAPEAEPSVDPPALTSVTPEPASATETGTPALPAVTETPSPTPARLLDHGKWHYSPSGSPCVYNELKRIQALYRNFAYDEVILMDSENCAGTWYVFYPSTGEAVGGLQDPDDPRLRLRLIGGKVTVTAGKDGCTWIESRRQADSTGRTIVSLDTNCGKYDYGIWYFPQTGELQFVIA